MIRVAPIVLVGGQHDLAAALPRLELVGTGADRGVDGRPTRLELLGREDAEGRERHLGREGHVGVAQREPDGQLVDRLDAGQVAGVLLGAALGAFVDGDRLEVGLLGVAARFVVVVAPAGGDDETKHDEQG